ncbi:hypothetical protein EHI8A_014290 [Entamoeba histolytica HM-1:IMSS-B]|uniref:Uncharacterized protein n=6 Tax=Entamoeba histolytica TaxID=5759 RepID=C4LVG1_ENTH1|nr:hypothetical protein EHI_197450 [Entamoeba histolytica HM-1:IMSS]EMD49580.1 Hypothetical protein EHI5A_005650 [Entamoeba histolytica KU27]EMH77847.1 hypothetical protein EHI8A_014290 [Entamoeba histolytica HM-1:IMSS-B]ENY62043.1 hypothetical protein EHI7A_018170 [Entamoeba histolytica HM-1:IMSS-A]GAT92651.1 hypothetical protein CL6EHI_197450 [Entamoeba histolytica]EAL46299.1 hypothetical protein EHI_197450 [Entamoeba histolytica HM-1:IMSS]|eukprot:XP_651686.1 hypothetical protein EHI_197450 [Entamoeba histolytica HM-1:IMSS]
MNRQSHLILKNIQKGNNPIIVHTPFRMTGTFDGVISFDHNRFLFNGNAKVIDENAMDMELKDELDKVIDQEEQKITQQQEKQLKEVEEEKVIKKQNEETKKITPTKELNDEIVVSSEGEESNETIVRTTPRVISIHQRLLNEKKPRISSIVKESSNSLPKKESKNVSVQTEMESLQSKELKQNDEQTKEVKPAKEIKATEVIININKDNKQPEVKEENKKTTFDAIASATDNFLESLLCLECSFDD